MNKVANHLTLEHLGLRASVNPLTPLFTDGWFEFPGYFRRPAHCRLDIFARDGGDFRVVIATELDKNDGVSITDGAESLASTVCKKFHIQPENLIMIEHYHGDNILAEHWSLVRFKTTQRERDGYKFEIPEWFHLEKRELKRLLGLEIA